MNNSPKWCRDAASIICARLKLPAENEQAIADAIQQSAPNLGEIVAASFELAQHGYSREEHHRRFSEALASYYD